MAEYIERNKVLEMSYCPTLLSQDNPLAEVKAVVDVEDIESIPTADVEEVKHGKWVAYPHNSGIYCSECRHKRRYKDMNDKFCPNCGAKMDE